jgi:hypothetical protein
MFWRKSCPTTKPKQPKTDAGLTSAKTMNFGIGCAKFGVSEDKLHAAIEKVGTNADDVARELGK